MKRQIASDQVLDEDTRAAFDRILAKVPAVPPDPWDRWDEKNSEEKQEAPDSEEI
jgi:hypothetical protein